MGERARASKHFCLFTVKSVDKDISLMADRPYGVNVFVIRPT